MKNTNGFNEAKITKLIWYSTQCSYWTDDFRNLSTVPSGSIPCCPHCGCVGYQMGLDEWHENLTFYNEEEPGYQDFIIGLKTICRGSGVSPSALWEDYKRHKLEQRIN